MTNRKIKTPRKISIFLCLLAIFLYYSHAFQTGPEDIFKAAAGHIEIVEYLLSKGADIDARNNARQNPLLHAAYYRKVQVGQQMAKEFIQPKQMVPMHMREYEIEKTRIPKKSKQQHQRFPRVF